MRDNSSASVQRFSYSRNDAVNDGERKVTNKPSMGVVNGEAGSVTVGNTVVVVVAVMVAR